jgi:hypothetical protein
MHKKKPQCRRSTLLCSFGQIERVEHGYASRHTAVVVTRRFCAQQITVGAIAHHSFAIAILLLLLLLFELTNDIEEQVFYASNEPKMPSSLTTSPVSVTTPSALIIVR